MDAPPTLVRLALGGLLLEPWAFRAQRDDPAGLRRGFALVLVVAFVLALAAYVGDLGEYFTQPDPALVSATLREGIAELPIYGLLAETDPELLTAIDQLLAQPGLLTLTPDPLAGLLSLLITPVLALIGWLLGGSLIHLAARAFGGAGRFNQTLATTALGSGVNLLGLVTIVPYAEQFGISLLVISLTLGMIVSYLAVRETHGLLPWRAFWAVLVGPLLLAVLIVALYCCVVFVFAGALTSLTGGA